MLIMAIDTEGNEFLKTVKVYLNEGPYRTGKMIINFGWPEEYFAKDLLKHYPYQQPMIIDMMGRNHKGYQVSISAKQMNKIIEELVL